MTNIVSCLQELEAQRVGQVAEALAERLERGVFALDAFARSLSEDEWQRVRVPGDGRTVGVIVHHVAHMYPIEIELARTVASGTPVTGLTWDVVRQINADHAREFSAVTRDEALALLRRNSAAAATAIRGLSDEVLTRAVPISLYDDAPLTCQFALEDHAVRHAYHHLHRVRLAVEAARAVQA